MASLALALNALVVGYFGHALLDRDDTTPRLTAAVFAANVVSLVMMAALVIIDMR